MLIMTIRYEKSVNDFRAWGHAQDTLATVAFKNKEKELDELCEEIFPNGCTETELNDFLTFDRDYIFDTLGIERDED